ncbi:MAG TPA: type IV pilin-like G/H family protein [Allocoleopsis sp.]
MLVKLLLNQSTKSNGAILIKWLVLGGLSSLAASIASSSAYSQQSLPGQLEARKYIGIINYAQAKYYQTNHNFAYQLGQLNTGIPAQTNYYSYSISSSKSPLVTEQAIPLGNRHDLKAVIGGVAVFTNAVGNETLITKRCLATLPPAQGGPKGVENMVLSYPAAALSCPNGYQELKGAQ